ncbi:hypothetical protein [Pedobacter terrae]|nr:hypothetical protein [Pedobacter terrae]
MSFYKHFNLLKKAFKELLSTPLDLPNPNAKQFLIIPEVCAIELNGAKSSTKSFVNLLPKAKQKGITYSRNPARDQPDFTSLKTRCGTAKAG